MKVLVLTKAGGLADEQIGELASIAGGEARRLGTDAAEIPVWRALPNSDTIDVNVVTRRARVSVFLADMDSTMIGVECIDELADFAGVKTEVASVTEAAMRGELDFEQALRARVALLEGLAATALEECYAERVRLNSGARCLVRTLAARGVHTALVSGGFTFFTERVARAAGFHEHHANTLEQSGGKLTGRVREPILGREAKREALIRLTNGNSSEAVAVGDGANDLAMIEAAGLGVAYRAKPRLWEAADARLDHSDLSAILALLGIPQGEYVAD